MRTFVAATLVCLAAPVFAQSPSRCIDIGIPKAAIAAHDGKWIALTSDQWQFMRGIYAMNPRTPPGLPYGDSAAMAKIDGAAGALIFFLDGSQACSPMPIAQELVDMLADIKAAKINHEGDGT